MTHIMIDLETMGLGMDAPIVAIGACSFNENAIFRTFRATIPLREAVSDGAYMDPDTVEWWLQQSDEARASLLGGQDTLHGALHSFADFCRVESQLINTAPLVGVWGNGAAFDNALLRETYRRAGIECPWSYKLDRCFRTVKEDVGLSFDRRSELVEHDAEHDAVYQAEWLMAIWEMIG